MLDSSKCGSGAVRNLDRAAPGCRSAHDGDRRSRKRARRSGLAAIVVGLWAGFAAADDAPVPSTAPTKIAVFAFELEDFSAATGQEPSPIEATHLAQATEEAKRQLLQSGRYSLIDTAGADTSAAAAHGLRNCGGCEAAIAKELGADQALIGVVIKISMTEYTVRLQVSDARTGDVVSSPTTDLRMGTGDSWFRGVRWLIKNRMLASE